MDGPPQPALNLERKLPAPFAECEKATRFLVQDIIKGLSRALHYTKLITDFKLTRGQIPL